MQPVFQQPQEFVGRGEIRRVVATDVPAGPQGGQRVDRRSHMQRFVGATVDELQKLHRELDIAQSAAAELDFAIPDVGGHKLLDASPHRLDFRYEILTLAGIPDHRHQRVDVLLAQFGVTGGRPGFQQCLELPRLGPLLVVGDMRVQGADQFAVAALRTQSGVDLEEGVRSQPHHLAGDPRGHRIGRFGHENHVDVADVVQFARTAFAHRDDRQPRRWVVSADGRLGDRQRGSQSGVGQVGQVLAHLRGRTTPARSRRSAPGPSPPAPATGCGTACAAATPPILRRWGVSPHTRRTGPAVVRATAASRCRATDARPADWRPGDRPAPATTRGQRTTGRAGGGRRPAPR